MFPPLFLIVILGLQPREKTAMLGVNTKEFFSENYIKTEFSSQRREKLLFLTTNMVALTSRANQQLNLSIIFFFHPEYMHCSPLNFDIAPTYRGNS